MIRPWLPVVLLLAMGLAGTLLPVGAGEPKAPPVLFSTDISGGDLQFLTSAAEQGLYQASLAALAADHAKSSEVKEFGETLAKHYAGQNERLKLIAMKKGLTIPSKLSANQNASAAKLAHLQGLKFDKAYMEEMVQDQQTYVALFEQATQSHDAEIKSFATASLPGLKQHLELVRKITGIAPSTGAAAVHFRTEAAGSEEEKK